ncbi:WbqC family protein [soil metagenome]
MNQLIEIQYFGCIYYYVSAIKSKHINLEQFETYQKMSYRNRCQVLGPFKVLDLTVPLLGGRDQKSAITEIQIDNQQRWQMQHWRTLESCYNKSAFFLHYKDDLQNLIFVRYESLWQLNVATVNWVIKKLKAPITITYTECYQKLPAGECLDFRDKFLPSNRKHFELQAYQQVFEKPFEPNLSILDLLFNMGPQALHYLMQQLSPGNGA